MSKIGLIILFFGLAGYSFAFECPKSAKKIRNFFFENIEQGRC